VQLPALVRDQIGELRHHARQPPVQRIQRPALRRHKAKEHSVHADTHGALRAVPAGARRDRLAESSRQAKWSHPGSGSTAPNTVRSTTTCRFVASNLKVINMEAILVGAVSDVARELAQRLESEYR
jgi:hypothetical protein